MGFTRKEISCCKRLKTFQQKLDFFADFRALSVLIPGLGVFAKEYIPAGTTYRILKSGQNMIVLNGPEDVPPLTDSTKQYLGIFFNQIVDKTT